MKSKQLVLIAIALLCGLVSAIGIIQAMGNKGPVAEKIPMGPVLVASAHLDHKAKLTEENVSLENWPKSLIPEGAATELTEVTGKHIVTRLRTGQAIIMEDVKDRKNIPGLAIPPNHKVINIKVPSEDLLAGLLQPGDRVDIIGIFDTNRDGDRKSETKTFLKAIRVFNIGGNTTAQEQKGKGNSSAGIVGVLVTEPQSEKIVWAKKNGTIRLAMIGDTVDSEDQEDPHFPMDNEPEIAQPTFDFNEPKMAKPQIDRSKLRQVKVYADGKATISYFDEAGNEISVSSKQAMGVGYSSNTPMGSSSRSDAGSSSRTVPGGANDAPPADYEENDDSVEFPNGIEEDQYQGE